MSLPLTRIYFIGAGAIGTSLGNALAKNPNLQVRLLSIEEDVVRSINENHINFRYFPSVPLHSHLTATTNIDELKKAEVIFLAIPSGETVRYLYENREHLSDSSVIINLAKGFGENHQTISSCLADFLKNPLCSMKGPTFARDIMNNQPTGFTVGSKEEAVFPLLRDVFRGSHIYLDFTTDIEGVEILSILKNIYAIVIGIADAHFDAPNLRFMILTKAFREMRRILIHFNGREQTMFHYCGFGDFNLTALNDLSRNRTLGLLIGKGFFTKDISDKVVLEGKIAVNIFCEELCKNKAIVDFPIIRELHNVFNNQYDISSFVNRLLTFENDLTE